MQFEGKFWLLWEDEPLDLETTRFFEFRDGGIYSARTGEVCGTYTVGAVGVDALFNEKHGRREVVKLRMPPELEARDTGTARVTPPFDPSYDSYNLTFSTLAYEEYQAGRPINDQETQDEEFDRLDWESEQFGIVPMIGWGYRDDPEVRELGEQNAREAAALHERYKVV